MEPRKIEKPVESRGEGQTASPRQPERKRRFQIAQLEERIAPQKKTSYLAFGAASGGGTGTA
jgi:hypothetical protein